MKAAVLTLGCKVNQYESDVIMQRLVDEGFKIVDFDDLADVYIVNTCSVTAVSDKKSRQALRRAKKQNPEAVVIAAGCYPQIAKQELASMEEIDICVGTENKYDLVKLAKEELKNRRKIIDIPDNRDYIPYEIDFITETYSHTRAHIKIEDGCNNFCSYCIIPYTRGRVRSKLISDAVSEFYGLAEKGYKEIVLTGIEVSSYGHDTGEQLIDLLEGLNTAARNYPDLRVRLSSLEPRIVTEEFTEKLSALERICPQYHLSLQSGSDAVLKRMNRKYSVSDYYRALIMLREAREEAMFTTDVIVGFPGETGEEFLETCSFVREAEFLKVHVFPYSVRPGTKAAEMDGQITKEQKEKRVHFLDNVSKSIRAEIIEKQKGKTFDVLFESEIGTDMYEGFSENYIPIRAASKTDIRGKVLKVRISKSEDDFCYGVIETV
ncbi:MAG: tRNA (N(6)-L-threonylcarbamoyladenosine(37)-C(2))-methylthiotransferase MtaB [Bacillota bacterium]|nr:tRNA (N(6)-L-threonylcarbamoyladenosine(37)-C(2))-methylthiotransferase MtaB [Bacillota bacterium]